MSFVKDRKDKELGRAFEGNRKAIASMRKMPYEDQEYS
jgi:hypothetical protein